MQRIEARLRGLLLTQRPQPLVDFIDVGARDGIPARWAPYRQMLQIMAIEPDATATAGLDGEVIPGAVADMIGESPLHITNSPGCSSLLQPNDAFLEQFPYPERFHVARTITVPTTTLDAHWRYSPAFLKIDVQGADARVLCGARCWLSTNVIGVEVETAFAPLYQAQSTFGDIHEILIGHGFELVDFRPTYWRRTIARTVPRTRGQLVFGDALYMLAPDTFAERPALARAACLACAVYGLHDWLIAYQSVLPTNPLLRAAAEIVNTSTKQWTARPFPLRYRLGMMLKDLGDTLLETVAMWAPAEQRLGGKPRL